MPLDATSFTYNRPHPTQTPCLDDAERQAAACFGPQLQAILAETPTIEPPFVAIAHLSAGVAGASFRLAAQGHEEAIPRVGEVVVAWVPAGRPSSPMERRALSLRIASAAAGAWRQRCQIERLGFNVS